MKYVIGDFGMTETAFWNSIIFTTIIALIGVVISILVSYFAIKKITAKNKEQLNEINDKAMDAQIELNKQQLANLDILTTNQAHLQTELFEQNEELTKKQLVASLNANAQLTWINDVRQLVALYITATTKLSLTLSSLYASHKILSDSEDRAITRGYDLENVLIDDYAPVILQRYQNDLTNYTVHKEAYDRQQSEINELATRLNLYFGSKPEHDLLRTKVRWFLTAERDFFKSIEEVDDLTAIKLSRQYASNIDDLSESFRHYFDSLLTTDM